jgi:RNA polymerase sigma-70 factor (ECF subfamily)
MPAFSYDRSKGSFKGWLQTTTRWKIIDQLRKRQRNRALERFPDSEDSEDGGEEWPLRHPGPSELEAQWQNEWEQNLVEVAIERVKNQVRPRDFQVFDFCTIKEWPAAKVANRLKLIRPQVYYLNKKVSQMIRHEITKLQQQLG